MKLSSQALGQRKANLIAKLDDLGDVSSDETLRGLVRGLRIVAVAPGAELPAEAHFEYEEAFRKRGAQAWELVAYAYEYRVAKVSGRRAYHLHDGQFHAHCLDPLHPSGDHHYRSAQVGLFEAHDEFSRLYLAGTPVTCDDLRPPLGSLG